jgi:hypothetical protein
MAYFVLTHLEAIAGDRKTAAKVFAVDFKILQKLAELSSTGGDAATARKVSSTTQFRELSGSEKAWIEQAVRRLIRRLGSGLITSS